MPGPELEARMVVMAEGIEEIRKFAKEMKGARKEVTQMQRATKVGRQAWGHFKSGLRAVGRMAGFLWGQLKRLGIVLVGVVTGLGVATAMFARKAIQAASSMEDLEVMLQTAYRSAKLAGAAFREAERLSIKTPFTPEEVVRGAVYLRMLRVVTDDMKELRKWLSLSADMAGALKANFLDAILAIGYGMQGESERLKMFGITAKDLIALGAEAAKSGIGVTVGTPQAAEKYRKAIEALISQRFRGGAKSLARTLSGLWSTFRGLVDFMWRDVAVGGRRVTSMFGQIKKTVNMLNVSLQELRDSKPWHRLTAAVSQSFGIIIGKGQAALKEGIPRWVETAGKAMGQVERWLRKNWAAAWQGAINAVNRASDIIRQVIGGVSGVLRELAGGGAKDILNTLATNFDVAMRNISLASLQAAKDIGEVVYKVAALGTALGAILVAIPGTRKAGLALLTRAGPATAAAAAYGIAINKQMAAVEARKGLYVEDWARVGGGDIGKAWQRGVLSAPLRHPELTGRWAGQYRSLRRGGWDEERARGEVRGRYRAWHRGEAARHGITIIINTNDADRVGQIAQQAMDNAWTRKRRAALSGGAG